MLDHAPPAASGLLLTLTAQIVCAHLGNAKVRAAELPGLVRAVHDALGALGQEPAEAKPPRPEPAIPVHRSVRPEAISCLECGARFRTLRRHLATEHGLTPEAYRTRWGLPDDYRLVAPEFGDMRSRAAKQIGLGRKPAPDAGVEATAAPDPAPAEAPRLPAKRRGRSGATAPPSAA